MTKEELMQYHSVELEVKQLAERIEELQERKTSIRSQIITDMPTGGESMDILTLITKIEDSQIELIKKQSKLVDIMESIEYAIDKLEDSTDRLILRSRYLQGKKWEEICVELNYSWRQIHRLHSNILKKIA